MIWTFQGTEMIQLRPVWFLNGTRPRRAGVSTLTMDQVCPATWFGKYGIIERSHAHGFVLSVAAFSSASRAKRLRQRSQSPKNLIF